MNWSLIPEIFFDVIGRLIPGSLLILTAAMVHLGPNRAVRVLLAKSSKVNTWSALLLFLVSYLVAVVVKQMWELPETLIEERKKKRSISGPRAQGIKINQGIEEASTDAERILYHIRKCLPAEASRLLKIQAEKNLCEVLIAGLSILWPINLWLWWSDSPPHFDERLCLLAGMTLSILSCWRWRRSLEKVYGNSLSALRYLLDSQPGKSEENAS